MVPGVRAGSEEGARGRWELRHRFGRGLRTRSSDRSLYHFKLLISLVEDLGLFLAQEFYWHNPGKMPAPAEWVTVRRIRVKDSVNCLWWLSKTANPKADNRKVLVPYSRDMERLIRKGYRAKQRPSGHNITKEWGRDHGGAICSNLIVQGNNDSNGSYLKLCDQAGSSHIRRVSRPSSLDLSLIF